MNNMKIPFFIGISWPRYLSLIITVAGQVREQMNLEVDSFPAGETYPEAQLPKMGKMAMKILSLKDEEFYEGMGRYLISLEVLLWHY